METWVKRDNPNIVVEAVRLNEDNVVEVGKWCNAEMVREIDPEHPQEEQWGMNVYSLGDFKRASLGMYIVKFGKHFFVEHNRKFELVYEPETRPAPPPESQMTIGPTGLPRRI